MALWEVCDADEGSVGLSGAPADPEFSPSGSTVLYTRTAEGVRELAWDANGSHSAIRMGGFIPAQPDWQPCVAGRDGQLPIGDAAAEAAAAGLLACCSPLTAITVHAGLASARMP